MSLIVSTEKTLAVSIEYTDGKVGSRKAFKYLDDTYGKGRFSIRSAGNGKMSVVVFLEDYIEVEEIK